MLTTEKKPKKPRNIRLPISGNIVSTAISLNDSCEIYPSRFTQKIHLINKRLAVAWSGTYYISMSLISKMKSRMADFDGNPNQLSENCREMLGEMSDADRENLSFVALALDEDINGSRPYYLGFQANQWKGSHFKNSVFMAGSGSYIMQENLDGIESGHLLMEADQHPDLKSLASILRGIGLQHFNELFGYSGLDFAFGGPFDLVVRERRTDGTYCLTTAPDASFSYWSVDRKVNSDIVIGFTGIIVYRQYIDGYLITATEHLEHHKSNNFHETGEIRSRFATYSIIGADDAKSVSPLLEKFRRKPTFLPRWNTLIFMEGIEDGFRTHIHHTFDDERLFFVSRSGDKFRMKLDRGLFEPIINWYRAQR